MTIQQDSPRRAAGRHLARRVSPEPGDSGTITVVLWNICDGRNGGLEGATKGMNATAVDVALFQEAKLTGDFYTKNSSGYTIAATDTAT